MGDVNPFYIDFNLTENSFSTAQRICIFMECSECGYISVKGRIYETLQRLL